MKTDHAPIEKASWGEGPWQHEPDRAEWRHAGLPCLAVRVKHYGAWCGYAAVPPGHPLHGKDYDDVDADVHGGLTYADKCQGEVCHVPAPGEPDDVWWFGFDCVHAGDLAPASESRARNILGMLRIEGDTYKTLEYVTAEVNRLAEQLAGAK